MGITKAGPTRTSKLERLWEPHVAPLNRAVASWRHRPDLAGRTIPWFDPDDGGIEARVLLLLEAPAPATARSGDDSFCSEDNDDSTNRTLKELRSRSGLERWQVVKWNVVPWAPPTPTSSPPAPKPDIPAALPALHTVMQLLPSTGLVITFGVRARVGFQKLVAAFDLAPLEAIAVPHPSQRNARHREETLAAISAAFAQAAAVDRR